MKIRMNARLLAIIALIIWSVVAGSSYVAAETTRVFHGEIRLEGYLNSWITKNFQVNSEEKPADLNMQEFDRKNHPFIGTEIMIDGEFLGHYDTTFLGTDEEGNRNYRVDYSYDVTPYIGDTFSVAMRKGNSPDAETLVSIEMLSRTPVLRNDGFINEFEVCWTVSWRLSGQDTWCGVVPASTDYWFWFYFYGFQCLEEGEYFMELRQNGELKSEKPFRPSDFQPGKPRILLSKDGIVPRTVTKKQGEVVYTSEGETVSISAYLEDDIVRGDFAGENGRNCGVPMKDVDVVMMSTVRPESGSHKHFKNAEEIGTGKFVSSLTPWDAGTYEPTKITLPTNDAGAAVAEYQSGMYGVGEKITATVSDADLAAEKDLDIKVPGLVSLDTSGDSYVLRGSYSNTCDKQHNDGAENRGSVGEDRKSHYVTRHTKCVTFCLERPGIPGTRLPSEY